MLNVNPLLTAALRDIPNAQRLALIRRIESWLVLSVAQATEQCMSSVTNESDARKLNEMLVLVRSSLCRDLGITAVGGEAQFKKLNDDYAANALAPAQRALYDELNVAFALGATLLQKFPAAAAPAQPSPEDLALRAQLDALYQRQLEAQKYTVPPLVTAPRLDTMAELVADYRALLKSPTARGQLLIDISFFAAHATYALARGWQQLGSSDKAARCYADAAPLFKRGERPHDAEQSAKLARQLGYAARSDFDGASVEALRTLIDGKPDAFTRARAYAALADLSFGANSLFDALHYADQAAAELSTLGFVDVETPDFDAAFQKWLDTASRADLVVEGGPVEHLNEVSRLYLRLLGIRFANRTHQQLASAAAAQAASEKLAAAMTEVNQQVSAAEANVMSSLARYRP